MRETIYIFDLGGILINLDVDRCMRAFERIMGEQTMRAILGMDPRGEGVKAVSVANRQLMADFERGNISPEAFVTEVLRYCKPGTTEEEVKDAWMAMLDELPAERLEVVDKLRAQGYPVYLLSNGNDLHFEFIDRTYGIRPRFERCFLSQEMHMAKPEPAIYEAVDRVVKADHPEAKQIIFMDDIETNRLAAERIAGWTTLPDISSL
jgi:putative hydrolase of the HAD superfamily